MIALVEAYKAGLWQRKHWLSNVVAGTIVGIVALPLAMAFAIASGAKPEQGLYTAIVAGFMVSCFGGSRLQIAGPTGAFIVILSGITATHGMAGLQLATLMAGVILVCFGIARLGVVIRFIPDSVIAGFTAGIGVIIWVGQWKDFFGLPTVGGAHFHQKLWHLIQALPQWHPATTGLAMLSLLIVLLAPRISWLRRVPGPLMAMVVATVLQAAFHFDGVATIGSAFGGIPSGLPTFQMPHATWAQLLELIGPAFTIAMLCAIESLLSAVVADGMAGTRHDSNQELIGQGLANLCAPLFGGFAETGAIARTATNIRNGGSMPLAGNRALTVAELCRVFASTAVARDQLGGTPKAERDLLRDSGLLALSIPEHLGGAGASWSETLGIVRQIAQVDSSVAHVFAFHHLLLATALLFGQPAQWQPWFEATIKQRWFWGNALNPLDSQFGLRCRVGGGIARVVSH